MQRPQKRFGRLYEAVSKDFAVGSVYHHVTARHTHTSGNRYFRHLQVGPNVYAIGNPFDLDQILTTGVNLPGVLICQAGQHRTNYRSTGLLPRSIFVGGDNQMRVPVTLQSTP